MATTEKKSNFREDFPGYQGHIPYKYSIIGKTVGSTNETIKELLSTEPPKETSLKPGECTDFSHYNRPKHGLQEINIKYIHNIFPMFNAMFQGFIHLIFMD